MEYRQLEAKLVRLHRITEADMGAFKARLRVLKGMGVPDKPKVGKGTRLTFDLHDLWEMHVALTLTDFGLSPYRIVTTVRQLRTHHVFERVKASDDDRWLVLAVRSNVGKKTDDPQGFIVAAKDYSFEEMTKALQSAKIWLAVVNVSELVRDVT